MQSLNTKTSTRLGPIPEALKNKFIHFAFSLCSIHVSNYGFAAKAITLIRKGKLDYVYISKSIDLQILEASSRLAWLKKSLPRRPSLKVDKRLASLDQPKP